MPATVVLDLRARVYKRLLRYVTSPLGARLRAARRGLNGIRFGRRFSDINARSRVASDNETSCGEYRFIINHSLSAPLVTAAVDSLQPPWRRRPETDGPCASLL